MAIKDDAEEIVNSYSGTAPSQKMNFQEKVADVIVRSIGPTELCLKRFAHTSMAVAFELFVW